MIFKDKVAAVLVLLALIAGGYFLITQVNVMSEPSLPEEKVIEDTKETPVFNWQFEEAETSNLDGNPQTKVFLTAVYSEGRSERKLVDTVDGGCSELEEERHEGDVSDTGKVQCYYAGLGQSYRITESERGYLVERKFSEEALPNVTPPEYGWEVIAEF